MRLGGNNHEGRFRMENIGVPGGCCLLRARRLLMVADRANPALRVREDRRCFAWGLVVTVILMAITCYCIGLAI